MDPSAIDTTRGLDSFDPLSRHHTAEDPSTSTHSAVIYARQLKNRHGWRRIVVNFTPSWFAVTMGTGIVSILLFKLPFNADWLQWLSIVVFALNVFLYISFSIISLLRYTIFRGIWTSMLNHPVQSLFLGTVPMGLTTITNMVVYVCVPAWGDGAAMLAWGLWWITVVGSLATNLYLPFIVMHRHHTQLATMTAVWLLPIVAPIVVAASGSVVATVLPNPQHAVWTIIISYILWGCAVPLAMFTMVIYFQRLTLHSLPPREVIVSVFLPLGPLGQGAYGIMQLGKDAMLIFPKTNTIPLPPGSTVMAGEILYVIGLLVGVVMWGFGLVWLFFALASITRSKFPFNLGWWGFTFPLGVYSIAAVTIGNELPSLFFRVLGTITSLAVVVLWLVVSSFTVFRVAKGDIFVAPCVSEWESQQTNGSSNRKGKAKTIDP